LVIIDIILISSLQFSSFIAECKLARISLSAPMTAVKRTH